MKDLKTDLVAGESGGHYCDPLISFMMVYNAIKGNYKDFGANSKMFRSHICMYHQQMITKHMRNISDQLPYTDDELVEMSKLSMDDLKAAAAKVSIEDAASRAGN